MKIETLYNNVTSSIKIDILPVLAKLLGIWRLSFSTANCAVFPSQFPLYTFAQAILLVPQYSSHMKFCEISHQLHLQMALSVALNVPLKQECREELMWLDTHMIHSIRKSLLKKEVDIIINS